MSNLKCEPDNYAYCRRCGLEISLQDKPCSPPDILVLVQRRIASIVENFAIERDVDWAIRSLRDEDMRRKPIDR